MKEQMFVFQALCSDWLERCSSAKGRLGDVHLKLEMLKQHVWKMNEREANSGVHECMVWVVFHLENEQRHFRDL